MEKIINFLNVHKLTDVWSSQKALAYRYENIHPQI